ncbi:hypothetical protein E2C01_056465 [Portunus trituberculatus]|uniref:Uncharacterized protein n=1 Tax=Portunus trituberculatus TaxID=210409 RepID=A0A5B7GQP6_PORTR|nr:hypothetical protein [Portunus trituberculatus]
MFFTCVRHVFSQVVPHTSTSTMREHLHPSVHQPANTEDLIPRPVLRPSRSRQEERISHNSWVYGQDVSGETRMDMADIHKHSTSPRHYMDLDAHPVHHDYGDVYSVTRNLDQRTGRGYSHQHAANALWRVAPWAQGGYDWSNGWGNVTAKNKGVRSTNQISQRGISLTQQL